MIEAGLATWSGALGRPAEPDRARPGQPAQGRHGLENLERIRQLFDDLETKRDLVQLLGLAERGDGVHIFIGSENKLFSLSGSSLIVAPFEDERRKIVGVLGVIGPTRLNYARIIPMVDYTAQADRSRADLIFPAALHDMAVILNITAPGPRRKDATPAGAKKRGRKQRWLNSPPNDSRSEKKRRGRSRRSSTEGEHARARGRRGRCTHGARRHCGPAGRSRRPQGQVAAGACRD